MERYRGEGVILSGIRKRDVSGGFCFLKKPRKYCSYYEGSRLNKTGFPGLFVYDCFSRWNWKEEYSGTSRLMGRPAFISAEPE